MARQDGFSAQLERILDANSACGGTPETVISTSAWNANLHIDGWHLGPNIERMARISFVRTASSCRVYVVENVSARVMMPAFGRERGIHPQNHLLTNTINRGAGGAVPGSSLAGVPEARLPSIYHKCLSPCVHDSARPRLGILDRDQRSTPEPSFLPLHARAGDMYATAVCLLACLTLSPLKDLRVREGNGLSTAFSCSGPGRGGTTLPGRRYRAGDDGTATPRTAKRRRRTHMPVQRRRQPATARLDAQRLFAVNRGAEVPWF